MQIDQIKELVDLMIKGGLSRMEIVEDGNRILLESNSCSEVISPHIPAIRVPDVESIPDVGFNNISLYTSPMVGVFYAAPSPDAQPFVKVGDQVKKGDVLCIVEAMKLMNELTADESGEILDICVSDGDIVEFGQTIFKIL